MVLFATSISSFKDQEKYVIQMQEMDEIHVGKVNSGLKTMCVVIRKDLNKMKTMHSNAKAKKAGSFVCFKQGVYIYRHCFHLLFRQSVRPFCVGGNLSVSAWDICAHK